MATNILTKIFGSRNDRLLKQYRTGVARINTLEAQYEQLSDDALKAKPDVAATLYMRGWAERASGDTARGAADIDAARRLDPKVSQRYVDYGLGT